MIEIKAPNNYKEKDESKTLLFLAGSIEMGAAEDWQKTIINGLSNIEDLIILNPRRDDWDSSWEQSIHNEKFFEQVTWELRMQECCDLIFMYFAPSTKSPISLLELGLFARSERMIVCCPSGFWRKGSVDIVCARYGVKQTNNITESINMLRDICR
ncbi:MAG: nucleoside 2-deoxyribosyltransferase domain-containing protein [Candidatus Omnitrophica bacterium]|nr:nucleoside 2-deoxyribosyltransferase domain-containing protein [Candidatus Omnitrophota bacterium]